MGFLNNILNIILFLIMLGVLITIHELGQEQDDDHKSETERDDRRQIELTDLARHLVI